MSAIDYHYQTIGRILVFLIQKGLARVDLDESNALEIMTERHGDEEEVLKVFSDCLMWMMSEGLIRSSTTQEYEGGFAFNGVQLTSVGIALIKKNPQDADIGLSIEGRVKDSENTAIDSGLFTKIGEFVGAALGGLTKSLAGG